MSEKLGEAFVAISANTKGLTMGLDIAHRSVEKAISRMNRIAVVGLAAATAGFVAVTKKMVILSSNAAEMKNVFSVAFGSMTVGVEKWAESYSKSVGRSVFKTKNFAAMMQSLLKTQGFTTETASKMSKQLVETSRDLSSFWEKFSDEEVIEKLRSGLIGLAKPLRQLGIDISDVALKRELASQGLDTNTQKLSQNQKMMLRYQVILKQSKMVTGDLFKTQFSFANQLKRMKDRFFDLGTIIGQKLLPALNKIIIKFNDWLDVNQDLIVQKLGDFYEDLGDKLKWVAENIDKVIVVSKILAGILAASLSASVIKGIATAFGLLFASVGLVSASLASLGNAFSLAATQSTTSAAIISKNLSNLSTLGLSSGKTEKLSKSINKLPPGGYKVGRMGSNKIASVKVGKIGILTKSINKLKSAFKSLHKTMSNTSLSFPTFTAFFKGIGAKIVSAMLAVKGFASALIIVPIKAFAATAATYGLTAAVTSLGVAIGTYLLPVLAAWVGFKVGKWFMEWLVKIEAVEKALTKVASTWLKIAGWFGGGDKDGKKVIADMDERLALIKDIKEAKELDAKTGEKTAEKLQNKFNSLYKTNSAYVALENNRLIISKQLTDELAKQAKLANELNDEQKKALPALESELFRLEKGDYEADKADLVKEYNERAQLFKGHEEELIKIKKIATIKMKELANEQFEEARKKQKEAMGGIDSELFKFEKGEAASKRKELAKTLKEQLKLFADNEEAKIKVARLAAFKLAEINKETSASNKATSFTDFRGVVTSGQAAVSSIGAQASSKQGVTKGDAQIVSAIEKLIAKEEQNAKKLSNDNNRDY